MCFTAQNLLYRVNGPGNNSLQQLLNYLLSSCNFLNVEIFYLNPLSLC